MSQNFCIQVKSRFDLSPALISHNVNRQTGKGTILLWSVYDIQPAKCSIEVFIMAYNGYGEGRTLIFPSRQGGIFDY